MIIKGFVIAGTKSSSGKTTLTLGLLAALRRRGLRVAPFKVGPDFIDPGHHSTAAGQTSYNLDGWMLSKEYNLETFARRTLGADMAVIEGVMGLFDGYDGKNEAGSTAQMAKWLGLPVLLVVDARSMARSAAALVQGFERFDGEVSFAGVVFNNVGSRRHLDYLTDALVGNVKMPCLGGVVRDENILMPERHLGLVTREDYTLSEDRLEKLANIIEENIQVDRLLEGLPLISPLSSPYTTQTFSDRMQVKIGVARDRAFCFYYPDNLEILERYGAELIFFSPTDDRDLPKDLDGLYFGGGYPELSAKALSANTGLRKQILEKSVEGMPIYGECGGFMYLCREMCDSSGNVFPMVGCFPFRTRIYPCLKSLGYREITLLRSSVIGDIGLCVRGHEFHYSGIEDDMGKSERGKVFSMTARTGHKEGDAGWQVNQTLGSYIHLHFGSQPDVADFFVNSCFSYQQKRKVYK
jgi:cobyrinic acid a,c-diamide synthase